MKFKLLVFAVLLALMGNFAAYAHELDEVGSRTPAWFGAAAPAAAAAVTTASTRAALMAASFSVFKPKVRYYWDDTYFYEESDGIPDRTMMPNLMVGITAWNRQVPMPASYFASTANALSYNYWQIPLTPSPAATPQQITSTTFTRGAIALASNGVPIFNPHNNTGALSQEIGELDTYGGHSGRADDYHYHIAPIHLLPYLGNDKPIAWVLDGYPMYGYQEPDGTAMQTLDSSGGHDHGSWGYHYHAPCSNSSGTWTISSPYMNPAFHGAVSYVGLQVDPQPSVTPLRDSGTALEVNITAFKNPVALTTDASGNLRENTAANAQTSADQYLMRYTVSGTSYDICWRLNRNASPKTVTTTTRPTSSTNATEAVTTTSTDSSGRVTTYPMAASSMLKLPDTSQTLDSTATTGEDADYTTNSQSFIDNNNGTVTDNVTGLMWQKVDNGESTWDLAVTNAAGITSGGYSDWRLPTPSELFSIFNHNNNSPALNTTYFPSHPTDAAEYWWTSDIYGSSTTQVWVSNAGGGLGGKPKASTVSAGGTERYHARYVRGASPSNGHNYLNNGDGTITDLDTSLMWAQIPSASLSWEGALAYAEALSLGGYSDWRLPNVKELQTLTDYTLASATSASGIKACINRTLFSTAAATAYWSSTSLKNSPTEAWLLELGINTSVLLANGPPRGFQGIISYEKKTSTYPVFAVRTTSVVTQIGVTSSATALSDGVSTVTYSGVAYGTSSSKTFIIANNGSTSLNLTGVTVDGANASNFTVTSSPASTLAAGATTTLTVQFNASTAGAKSATLHIASSDTTVGTAFDINLSGTPVIASPTLSAATVVAAASGGPVVNATASAGNGTTLSSVQVAYNDGGQSTTTVFSETMGTTAVTPWTGLGTDKAWTLAVVGPADTFALNTTAHLGTGTGCGLQFGKGSTSATDSMITTTNAISAAGSSGYVEFKVATSDMISPNGWTFQLSSDGGTTWNTRLSELTGNNHTAQTFHYDLAASELVSTLKMRFQFVGYNAVAPARPPKAYLDDIKVVVTANNASTTLTMLDDGLHSDGAAGDRVYGVQVLSGLTASPATYTITATDATGAYTSAPATLSSSTLTLSPTTQTVVAAGGTYSLTIASSATWTLGTLPSWITASASSGKSGLLTLNVAANTNALERSYTITVGSQSHVVTQSGAQYATIVGGSFTLNLPARSTPASYVVTNLPSGLRLSASAGAISGIPTKAGSHSVSVTPVNSSGVSETTLVYPITVSALSSGVVGTFHGLTDRNSALNSNLGACLQIVTTSTGAYTGRMVVGAVSIVLKGQLSASASSPTTATLSQTVPRLGAGVTLALNFNGTTQEVTGTLSDGTHTAAVSAWRNPWSSTGTTAARYRGLHSFYFAQSNNSVSLPQGYGFGSVNVTSSNTGLVSLSSSLADGSKITSSTFVGYAGEVLLYAPLNRGSGSLAGTLIITPGSSAPLNNSLAGAATWLKTGALANSTDTVYAAGFGPLSLTAAGGYYTATTSGGRFLALPATANNAALVFTKGGLDTEGTEFSRLVTLFNPSTTGTANRATVAAGSDTLTLPSLTASTGAFGGVLTIAGSSATTTRRVTFQGQVVTTGALTKGYGFFLLPELPTGTQTITTSPKHSGRVTLEKQ
jgi:Protein of unknown function (DUF1566)/Abnormal spindle-like microcephaly-assoc'd, ASPM-SPD-2-Hydin/YHYH protein/Putative Ig domain